MKKISFNIVIVSALAFSIIGCASSGIIELDKGTYYISKSDGRPGFGPPSSSVIRSVYAEANDFCAKSGKVVKTTKKTITDAVPGRISNIKVEFLCVQK